MKALRESGDTPDNTNLYKMKAGIEFIGDYEDLKKVAAAIKALAVDH